MKTTKTLLKTFLEAGKSLNKTVYPKQFAPQYIQKDRIKN